MDEDPQMIDMVPMVQQRLLLDILPHEDVDKFWAPLHLVPPGPEVVKAMQDESVARMGKVAALVPVIEMYIVLTADIITEAMFYRLMSRLEDDEDRERALGAKPTMTEQNRQVVRASLYSSVAHMIDSGFIQLTPAATS